MPKLPHISGAAAIRSFAKLGFVAVRQRGSHVVLKHVDGRGCVVPLHKELKVGTLAGIIKQANVSVDEFLQQL